MDPLKYIFESPHISTRVAKWQVMLAEFDIQYMTRKAVKGGAIADHLAENPSEDYQPIKLELPDEDILEMGGSDTEEDGENMWKMYFDGAVNIYGNGIGAVIISPHGKQYPIALKLAFDCTNNMAEYEACIHGLKAAISLGIRNLEVYGDSSLIIYQVNGKWQVKDPKLQRYHECLTKLIEEFDETTFHYLSREKNQFADALATLAVMIKLDHGTNIQPLQVKAEDAPAHCSNVEELNGKPWFFDIKQFIKTKEYPSGVSENDKRTLRRLAMSFFLDGEVLYKRNYDSTLLRCADESEAKTIMEEVHEGVCGTHANGHTLARQILRHGYYWTTLEKDCMEYVRKCHKCQVYADRINLPPTCLHNLTSPWPFSLWGIDVIGPINPKATNGHRFILVAIDYFTKWVEAASYANVTQKAVLRFLKINIMCRYGLPERIITDNAANLTGAEIQKFCEKFKIKHHNSTPYRPKMNGAVEAANKNIKKILGKMVTTYKDWSEMLPYALHAYRTSVRSSTGATPYSLVYGMEAVTPIEVEIPSLRVLVDAKLEDSDWVKARLDQLNLIEEKRLTAICHGQLYQRRMARAFNKNVRPRTFQVNDLVLKRILPNQEDPRGKWAPTYEGPYVVKEAFSGGALILSDMEGRQIPRPVNSDMVKKYYA